MTNPLFVLISKVWKFSKGRKNIVILFIVLSIFAQIIGLMQTLVIGRVLNIIQEQGANSGSIGQIMFTLSWLILIVIGFWIFHGTSRYFESKNAFLAESDYRIFLIEGVMHLPAKWHTEHHSGDTIDKIKKASEAVYDFASHSFEVIEMLINFVGATIVLAIFDLSSLIPIVIMTMCAILVVLKMDVKLRKQYKELNQRENDIQAQIFDTISNIVTVIILRIEKLLKKEIWKKIMKPYGLYLNSVKLNEWKWAAVSMCTAIMSFWVVGGYIYSEYKAGATILAGSVFILYGYTRTISSQFFRFAYRYGDIVRWSAKIDNIREIENKFSVRKKVKNNELKKWKEITIENLNFSYQEEEKIVHIDNINMNIKKGQKIAFIGASGSGKSTMLKLIRGLYKPNQAKIYFDGKEEKKGFAMIADQVTLIPQEPEIFNTTIKRNITVGLTHSKKVINKFIRMARFSSVLKRLPKGLETNVMEKGVSLSGGEKQRLALARGLMAIGDSEFILLDEPTSSVDTKNESEIYSSIFRSFKNKTIIASVHNLNKLTDFDYVYNFKNGKIVEYGKFEDLKKNGTEFQKLWKKYYKNKKSDE